MRYELFAYINITPPYTTTVQRTNALRKSYQMYMLCAARAQLCEKENAGTYSELTSRTYATFLMTSMGINLHLTQSIPRRTSYRPRHKMRIRLKIKAWHTPLSFIASQILCSLQTIRKPTLHTLYSRPRMLCHSNTGTSKYRPTYVLLSITFFYQHAKVL
jgi:hypothetical protein